MFFIYVLTDKWLLKQRAYLQYTKLDAMNVPRRLPAFKSWNANLLISRETLELDRIKYFGMVDIIGGLNEEEQTAQKEVSVSYLL